MNSFIISCIILGLTLRLIIERYKGLDHLTSKIQILDPSIVSEYNALLISESIQKRMGLNNIQVYLDSSKEKTSVASAVLTENWNFVIMKRSLLDVMGPKEIATLLAHEFSHLKRHRLNYWRANGAYFGPLILSSIFLFFASYLDMHYTKYYKTASHELITLLIVVALYAYFYNICQLVIKILFNWASRREEYVADKEAYSVVGFDSWILMAYWFKRADETKLSVLDGRYTHPLWSDRIKRIIELESERVKR